MTMRRRNIRPRSDVERRLLRYQNAVAEEALLLERIDRLDSRARALTRQLSGVPSASGKGMTLPELADERERLSGGVKMLQRIKEDALALLAMLPDDERRLMTAYYVEGLSIERAAEFVPCSRRTAFALKEQALRRLASLDRRPDLQNSL